MNENICFLVYQSRSGSTFLSRLLNENKHLSVTPEADFNYAFSYKNKPLLNVFDIENILCEFFNNKKSKSWNFSKQELQKKLLNFSFPIKFSDFLNTLVSLHFSQRDINIIVFKGVFPNKIPQLKKQFPRAKFILISRDFRAVYNSQKKTINFNTGRPMSKNPFLATLEYILLNRFIETYQGKCFFQNIIYEDLVHNQENVLAEIYDFLGVPNEKSKDDNYVNTLSDEHKNIHTNVNKPAQKQRVVGWKKELNPVYISIIQSLAKKSLLKNGYSIEPINLSFSQRMKKHLYFWAFLFRPKEIYVVLKDFFKLRYFSSYKLLNSN